ncbi:hypothetical protein EVAR_74348_1 [Eumeta japonica]|uniref:Uncharacterized protein n=1 Tax=Eumeta variegata TaxID=151549 RepID=A0A4C1SCU7_EUMVA|nr:hypothetical protein EVAR_74348_1 [Eumeta japonica]
MNDSIKKRDMKVNVSKTKVMVFERGASRAIPRAILLILSNFATDVRNIRLLFFLVTREAARAGGTGSALLVYCSGNGLRLIQYGTYLRFYALRSERDPYP